jgi:hypothetical protein
MLLKHESIKYNFVNNDIYLIIFYWGIWVYGYSPILIKIGFYLCFIGTITWRYGKLLDYSIICLINI